MKNCHICSESKRCSRLNCNGRCSGSRFSTLITSKIIAGQIGNGGIVVGVLANIFVVWVRYAAIGELFEDI